MATTFSTIFADNWPCLVDMFGESATFTLADASTSTVDIIVGTQSTNNQLIGSLVETMMPIEFYCLVSDAPATFTAREDSITIGANTYVIYDRQAVGDTLYRYICESSQLDGLQCRGRAY